jgi:hypothetical protein
MIKNLSFVMYTNEKYLPIAKLSVDKVLEYFKLSVPKYLATNRLNKNFDLDYCDFKIIDTNTPFKNDGSHFRNVMLTLLNNHVKTKYFLYFSEDYYLIKPFKINNLIKLLCYIEDKDIGYMSLIGHPQFYGSKNNDTESYDLPDIMQLNPMSYIYSFSMQPCIWNKDFFLQIIDSNQRLTLPILDTTNFKNRKNQPLSSGWDYNWTPHSFVFDSSLFGNYAFDTHNGIDDYYILLYSEIVRGGKFNLNTHNNNKNTVNSIIKQYNITSNPIYQQFL